MRKDWLVPAIVALLACRAATAAGMVVQVTDQQGRPVPDAVVTGRPHAGAQTVPARAAQVHVIDQKDLMFHPYVELLRPGDTVVFRNSDGTRHHVYSFSPAKAFEFVLAPGQSSPPMTLAKPGVVAVGCNIHDQMASYLVVSDAPWIAISKSVQNQMAAKSIHKMMFPWYEPGIDFIEIYPQGKNGAAFALAMPKSADFDGDKLIGFYVLSAPASAK